MRKKFTVLDLIFSIGHNSDDIPVTVKTAWENGEGYPDPTAYNALRPIMQEDAALEGKVNFLIKVLKFIIAESGFELLARIEIKDKKTGRCFR